MFLITFFLFMGLFSNFEELNAIKINSGKKFDSYKGSSDYTFILVDSGSMFSEAKKEVNIDISNITSNYIEKTNLKTVLISLYDTADISDLKKNIIEFKTKSLGNNKKLIRNKIRLLKRLIKLSNQDSEDVFCLLDSLFHSVSMKAFIEDDLNTLAIFLDYTELILYLSLDSDELNIININNKEYDFFIDSILKIEQFVASLDFVASSLTDLYTDIKKTYAETFDECKNLYKNSEISGEAFYEMEDLIDLQIKIYEEIFNKIIKNPSSINEVKANKLIEYSAYIFDKILSFTSNDTASKNIEILINSEFLKEDNLSILNLFKDKQISYIGVKPNSL